METKPDPNDRSTWLTNVVTHPQHLAFVLRLHRDAEGAAPRLQGRVQHLASGLKGDFESLAQLQEWIELRLGRSAAGTH